MELSSIILSTISHYAPSSSSYTIPVNWHLQKYKIDFKGQFLPFILTACQAQWFSIPWVCVLIVRKAQCNRLLIAATYIDLVLFNTDKHISAFKIHLIQRLPCMLEYANTIYLMFYLQLTSSTRPLIKSRTNNHGIAYLCVLQILKYYEFKDTCNIG